MNNSIIELITRYPVLRDCAEDIEQTFLLMRACYASGGKVLLCGNGGSAADAEHWAGELMKGFLNNRPLPENIRNTLSPKLFINLQGSLPTIPLTGYISLSTAFANDADPQYYFAQLVWALGKEHDILISLSTSGNSTNILYALETAAALGMKTIGLSGKSGGKMAAMTDICIKAPVEDVRHVQEYHIPIYHCLSEMLEKEFFPII